MTRTEAKREWQKSHLCYKLLVNAETVLIFDGTGGNLLELKKAILRCQKMRLGWR